MYAISESDASPSSWDTWGETYTADVNDHVRVGELGHRLRNDSLATTKGTGNSYSTTLDRWEKGVQHTLSDQERTVGRLLLGGGTRDSHGPSLHHTVFGLLSVELNFEYLLLDRVAALGRDLGDGSTRARRK